MLSTALLTGSGIGKGCALAYAAEGAAGVAFADMDKAAAETAALESRTLATNPQYRVLVVQVDVTKEAEVDRMVEETVREFGRIDYAFNSAGVSWCLWFIPFLRVILPAGTRCNDTQPFRPPSTVRNLTKDNR